MMVQGKLMEVDLPPPVAGTTPRAADRPAETSPRRAVAQAPGPDGRRWRSRKRRGSDDIKRDQLVEQFLHENRRTCAPVALIALYPPHLTKR